MTVEATTDRRLTRLLAQAQVAGRLPSVVAGVVRDGALVWEGAYGNVPDAPSQTQYRIGSITKTFTAVLVLQLVRDGRLRLDDAAAVVLGGVGYADRTIRSLLSHSSGMQAEPRGSWWERSAGQSWDELVAANDGSSAPFPAGQQYHYSNLGFALLGEVASRVHGSPWADCIRGQILDPLGLTGTSYLPTAEGRHGWSVDPYTSVLSAEPATDTRAMAPAGQLWSTVADLARYAAFLDAGHDAVLDRSWLELASHPQSGDRHDGLDHTYGLGLQLRRGGSGMLVGHTGSMPGFLAACLVDRPRRAGVVVLADATTGMEPGALARDLLAALEAAEPTLPRPWRPTTSVPAALVGVPGVWHWGNTANVLRLEGDDLVLLEDGEEWGRFTRQGDRVVGSSGYLAGETLRIVRHDDGSVRHLECATFVLTRTPYDPDAPIPGGHPG